MEIGRYNKCDYWCEKCECTDDCAVYKRISEKGTSGDFLEDVRESLDEAMGMLSHMAEELDIKIDEIEENDEDEVLRRLVDGDPLVMLARDFALKTHKFLNRIPAPVPEEVRDSLEDLQWYHTLVAVKTHRAMSSLYEDFMEDAVNSGEVARKSLQKCIAAFDGLRGACAGAIEECITLRRTAEKISADLDRAVPRTDLPPAGTS
jgi:hypothetical protein